MILAAGMGSRISELSKEMPKGFIQINGKQLKSCLKLLNNNNFKNIYIVTGYKKEHYEKLANKYENVITINNCKYSETEVLCLFLAIAEHVHLRFFF